MSVRQPFFSIIIPSYNRPDLLKEALLSVINQSFEDWEVIIIDDGSEIDVQEVVSQVQDIRIRYYYQEHQGRSVARNNGISLALGKYVCFLDDDDLLLDNHLHSFYDEIIKSEIKKIWRTGYVRSSGKSQKKMPFYQESKHKNPVRFIAFNMCFMTLCIPREFLDEDRFPVPFPHWQDTHLFLRLLSKYPFQQIEQYTCVYRIHPGSGSLYAMTAERIRQRAELNVGAIRDLFDRYGELVQPFLPSYTEDYLISEKYFQYAMNDVQVNRGENAFYFIKKSVKQYASIRLTRSYLLFVYFLLRKKFQVVINKVLYTNKNNNPH